MIGRRPARPGRSISAYAAGWGAVKALPARRRRTGRSAPPPTRPPCATAPEPGSCARTCAGWSGPQVSELRLDQLVGEALRSYSRYWLETFRLPKMDHGRGGRATSSAHTVGVEHIDARHGARQGLHPGAAAHGQLGRRRRSGWSPHGVPFTTVAERLKPESLFDRFVAYRESLGMEVLPLTGGSARRPTC